MVISVIPEPIAELNLDSVPMYCAPLQIDTLGVMALSYITAQSNDSIFWQVIDPSGLTLVTGTGLDCPSYIITDQNDYVWVVLIAYNDCGLDQDSLQIWTSEDPVADFTLGSLQGCSELTVITDTTSNSSIGSYSWTVFNVTGGISMVDNTLFTTNVSTPAFTLSNTSHTHDSLYVIQLIVGDPDNGCDSTVVSDTITVFHNPDAQFTISDTSLCAPDTVIVADISITGDSLLWEWSTDPINTTINDPLSNSTSIIFNDNQSGASNNYTIDLIVTDSRGCQDSIAHVIELYTRPECRFSIDSIVCGPDTISPINNLSLIHISEPTRPY